MKNLKMTWLLLVVCIVTTGSFAYAEGTIRMAGSSTVYKKIIEPAMSAMKEDGINIKANITGTGKGFIALVNGEADVLLASAPLDEVLKAAENAGFKNSINIDDFKATKIFEDEIRIITNYSNKVKKLTNEQLVGIFSGRINNWKDLGGKDLPIMVIAPEKGRATRQVFQDAVMGIQPFTDKLFECDATSKVDDVIRVNESAIGFTSDAFYYRGKLRIIETAKIIRPLLLITKGEPNSSVKKLADFLSGEGKKYWEDQDDSYFMFMLD